jgi:pyrroline-5-carboxylate reductase
MVWKLKTEKTMLDTIVFIGGGVMAEAMIQSLLNRQIIAPAGITVSEPREKRRAELEAG